MATSTCFLCSSCTGKQSESKSSGKNSVGVQSFSSKFVKNSNETDLFLTLACRYFHIKISHQQVNFKPPTGENQENVSNGKIENLTTDKSHSQPCGVCDSCAIETRQFCQLYHEWFQLQLKLNEKAKIISGLIATTSNSPETGTTGSHQGFRAEMETFKEQFRTKVRQVKEREIPRPVLEDLSKTVKVEVTENPTMLQEDLTKYQRPLPSSSSSSSSPKVDTILPNDADDNYDDARDSGSDGHRNEYNLSHPQDPLEDTETNDLDLDLNDGGDNEHVAKLQLPLPTKPCKYCTNNCDSLESGDGKLKCFCAENNSNPNQTRAPVPNILKWRIGSNRSPVKKKPLRFSEEETKAKSVMETVHLDHSVYENPNIPNSEDTNKWQGTKISENSNKPENTKDSENPNKWESPLLTFAAKPKPKPLKCRYCDHLYYSIGARQSHEMNAHVNAHHCRFCEKKFPIKHRRQRHEVTHLGLKSFRCLLCSKKLTSPRSCERHLRYVHRMDNIEGNLERKCEKCGQVFETSYAIMAHIISEHLPAECEHCEGGNREVCGHGTKVPKIKVDAILPNDDDDVATTSGNDGQRDQYILPHPQDPLEDETTVGDLDLDDNGGNEGAQEIPEPEEQVTNTRPTQVPVPNILKRKRNGDNPIEKKNGQDAPHEETKRMKKPTPAPAKIPTSYGNNPDK